MIGRYLLSRVRNSIFQWRWRNRNRHNETWATSTFFLANVKVGKMTYGNLTVVDYGSSARLKIGDYCSIADGVTFLLNGEHRLDTLSTFPFTVKKFGGPPEAGSKGDIVIGTDVWIGQNATICSGVSIGQGSIVAAGSIVTKSFGPYEILGGVPAKVLKKRFSNAIIEQLLQVNLASVLDHVTRNNLTSIYQRLTSENVPLILHSLVSDAIANPTNSLTEEPL